MPDKWTTETYKCKVVLKLVLLVSSTNWMWRKQENKKMTFVYFLIIILVLDLCTLWFDSKLEIEIWGYYSVNTIPKKRIIFTRTSISPDQEDVT